MSNESSGISGEPSNMSSDIRLFSILLLFVIMTDWGVSTCESESWSSLLIPGIDGKS